jgi:hypothetical protein
VAKKEYDTFVDKPEDLPEGEEVLIVIRELAPDNPRKKYLSRYVKAKVSKEPEKVPDWDILRLRSTRGLWYPQVMAIKITEEMAEYLPKQTVFIT